MKRILFFLFLLIIGSLIWTEIVLYSQNTLLLNGNWIVEKRMMQMLVMGSNGFLITRKPLARNHLDLSAWWGFQEVHYLKELQPEVIQFSFNLKSKTYVSVFIRDDEGRRTGVRISRNQNHPSMFFETTGNGRFEKKVPIPFQIPGGWQNAGILIAENAMIFRINDKEIGRLPLHSPLSGFVGFRGGLKYARIDDVQIRSANGIEFHDSFRNSKRFVSVAFLNLIVLTAIVLIVVLPFRFLKRNFEVNHLLLVGCFLATMIFMIGCSYFVFDFLYWSRLPLDTLSKPIAGETKTFSIPSFERLRSWWTASWYEKAGGRGIQKQYIVEQGYPDRLINYGPVLCAGTVQPCVALTEKSLQAWFQSDRKRIELLFVGSSQTFGAGSDTLDGTFFARVHKILASNLPDPTEFQSLNISASAFSSVKLFERYRDFYVSLVPEIVVINLGNNDEELEISKGITDFLELNRARKIRTVLVLEPNSDENPPWRLQRNHVKMKQLGQKYAVPVLDLQQFLNESNVRDSGFLWWDANHLAPYGHECVAEWLAPQLLEWIQQKKS